MKKLKTWDQVVVTAGKHKWKVSTIEKIDWDDVFLKWVNEVKKATKWKWFLKKTLPVHISNMMYYLEKEKKWTRVWIKITKWKKERFAKKDKTVVF